METLSLNFETFYDHLVSTARILDIEIEKLLLINFLNEAICNPNVRGNNALTVTVLKLYYDQISYYPDKPKNSKKNLTEKQICSFLRAWRHASLEGEKADLVFQNIDAHILKNADVLLNYSPEPFLNIQPVTECIYAEAVQQGKIGNCFFLAALASTAHFRKELIAGLMVIDEIHNAKVLFRKESEAIQISALTDSEILMPYASITSLGSWVRLIEKAYGAHIRRTIENSFLPRKLNGVSSEFTDLRLIKFRPWDAYILHHELGLHVFFEHATIERIGMKNLFKVLLKTEEERIPMVAFRTKRSDLPIWTSPIFRTHAVAVVGFLPCIPIEQSIVEIYDQAGDKVTKKVKLSEFCRTFIAIQRVYL